MAVAVEDIHRVRINRNMHNFSISQHYTLCLPFMYMASECINLINAKIDGSR